MRLGKVGGRPVRRVVGMRMIKADDVFAPLTALPLNADQLLRIDVVTILWRIIARIATTCNRGYHAYVVSIHLPKQDTTTLVRIGLLAMLSKGREVGLRKLQHWGIDEFELRLLVAAKRGQSIRVRTITWRIHSSQNLSLRYLSPESQRIVTKTARRSFGRFRAM